MTWPMLFYNANLISCIFLVFQAHEDQGRFSHRWPLHLHELMEISTRRIVCERIFKPEKYDLRNPPRRNLKKEILREKTCMTIKPRALKIPDLPLIVVMHFILLCMFVFFHIMLFCVALLRQWFVLTVFLHGHALEWMVTRVYWDRDPKSHIYLCSNA